MNFSLRKLLLAGLVPLAMIGTAVQADDLAAIKAAGVIKIGTEGTYAPFSYHDASNKLTGFDVEIGRAIAQKLGVKAEFVEGKWDGLIAGLDVKRYDAVINQVGITDARKAKYDFSDPYISSQAALIVREDNQAIKSFADLKGRKSANTLTSNFGKLAQSYGAEVVPVQGSTKPSTCSCRAASRPRSTTTCRFSTSRSKSPTPRSRWQPTTRARSSANRAC